MTVDAIKAAIQQLPDADRREIADWLDEQAEIAWDLQIEGDFSAGGRGQPLLEALHRQIGEGKFTPMDWDATPRPKRH